MTLLQPSLWPFLFAGALPILIHLLNRLRYRTVKWAAMLFLIRASRRSTRHSRLRQYLILASRALALLCVGALLTRPVTGGWLGRLGGRAPETVLILLDRSASMETRDPRFQQSLRERGLAMLAQAPAETVRGSRLFVMDSAGGEPREIAALSALPAWPDARATDTAADWPARLRAAADWLAREGGGRAELWIVTDLQASNWQPARPDWRDTGARLAALPRGVRVRVLALAAPPEPNARIRARQARYRLVAGRPRVDVGLDFGGQKLDGAKAPLALTADGQRTPFEAVPTEAGAWLYRTFEPAAGLPAGWGLVEAPADANSRDNRAYFAWSEPPPLRAWLVAEASAARRPLEFALAPPGLPGRACESRDAEAVARGVPPDVSLVLWQGALPSGGAVPALRAFAEAGGVVALFPPSGSAAAGSAAPEWGVAFDAAETAPAPDRPFRIGRWEERDGPLARTASGRDLPLAAVDVGRRAPLRLAEDVAASGAPGPVWGALAAYTDGRPLLARAGLGAGRLYACSTLPAAEWSTLEGQVLVPLLQRMMEEGGERRGASVMADCGRWRPEEAAVDTPAAVTCLDAPGGKDPRFDAGVYRVGGRLVALNRPAEEDTPDRMEPTAMEALFGPDLRVSVVDTLGANAERNLQSEIWRGLAFAALLFLLMEGGLLIGEFVRLPARAPAAARAAGGEGP